jgi:hypothetical protein
MKQFSNARETVLLSRESRLKRWLINMAPVNEEVAMDTLVANVLVREASKARTDAHPLALIALFCGVGLLASLAMVSLGFDLSAGFF